MPVSKVQLIIFVKGTDVLILTGRTTKDTCDVKHCLFSGVVLS